MQEKGKNDNNDNTADALLKHLPHYAALQQYDPADWVCFGTLTNKLPTAATTQLTQFKRLMDAIGRKNDAFAKRLHWVVRVETGDQESEDENERTHLHFLLGFMKVTNGYYHEFTPEEACEFLRKNWPHGGLSRFIPYDGSKDGLGYVLKSEGGPDSEQWFDHVEISPALINFLKEKKRQDAVEKELRKKYADRDPLALELFVASKKMGDPVYWGDEVPHWQKAS